MPRQFHHATGISVSVPHIKLFKPTPTMTALEIAYFRGKEARRLGRPDSENPHTDHLDPNIGQQAAEWMRGYGDTSK